MLACLVLTLLRHHKCTSVRELVQWISYLTHGLLTSRSNAHFRLGLLPFNPNLPFERVHNDTVIDKICEEKKTDKV